MNLGKRRVAGCAGIGRIDHGNDANMVFTYEIVKQKQGVKMSSQGTLLITYFCQAIFIFYSIHNLQNSTS